MKFKMQIIFVIASIAAGSLNSASAQKTITGFEAPESVIKSGNKLFVSNIGGSAKPNGLGQ